MITHCPAFKFFDVVKYEGKNPLNGKHVGFKGFTDFIKKYQPRVFVCGHMHEYQGIKQLGRTMIISVGAAKQGKAVIIDYPSNPTNQIKVTFIIK